jgi:hypothetical protein
MFNENLLSMFMLCRVYGEQMFPLWYIALTSF